MTSSSRRQESFLASSDSSSQPSRTSSQRRGINASPASPGGSGQGEGSDVDLEMRALAVGDVAAGTEQALPQALTAAAAADVFGQEMKNSPVVGMTKSSRRQESFSRDAGRSDRR